MITFDISNLNSFTSLTNDTCFKILEVIEREFGEIGNFYIEDYEVGFRVYSSLFENAPSKIINTKITLTLIDKSENCFSLGYNISMGT